MLISTVRNAGSITPIGRSRQAASWLYVQRATISACSCSALSTFGCKSSMSFHATSVRTGGVNDSSSSRMSLHEFCESLLHDRVINATAEVTSTTSLGRTPACRVRRLHVPSGQCRVRCRASRMSDIAGGRWRLGGSVVGFGSGGRWCVGGRSHVGVAGPPRTSGHHAGSTALPNDLSLRSELAV